MSKKNFISVLTPTYNEEENILKICEAVSEIAETAATSYYEDFSVSNYYQSFRLCREEALLVEIQAYCEVMHDNAWRLPRFTNADQQARRIADYKRTNYLLCLGIYS